MTRGRKKDLTIPPTRALVQQRDYRARKAHYVAELEQRCRSAEDENDRLRKELAAARAGLAVPAVLFSPETANASAELMQHLTLASDSLARFQQLAFSEPHFQHRPPLPDPVISNLRPASFPSPTPSLSPPQPFARADSSQPYYAGRKRLYREDSPQPEMPSSHGYGDHHRHPSSPGRGSRSPSMESDCCGGIMDCRDLVEREGSVETDDSSSSRTNLSGLRTTSDNYHPSTILRPCT